MSADSFFTIGKSHTVCQDYSRHGEDFALVSDGCSSSPDTDIGARLLVLAAEKWIHNQSKVVDSQRIIEEAGFTRPAACPTDCLYATLLSLVKHEGKVLANVAGDGVVAALRHDGTLEVTNVDFGGGAPAYLSYKLDPRREAGFFQDPSWGIRTVTTHRHGNTIEDVEDLRTGDAFTYTFELPADEFRAVFAFTDGVHSFQRDIVKDGVTRVEYIPMLEVVQHLTAIKSFTGSFLQRRAKAFLDRHCKPNGWTHYDDLSGAALDLGELP